MLNARFTSNRPSELTPMRLKRGDGSGDEHQRTDQGDGSLQVQHAGTN